MASLGKKLSKLKSKAKRVAKKVKLEAELRYWQTKGRYHQVVAKTIHLRRRAKEIHAKIPSELEKFQKDLDESLGLGELPSVGDYLLGTQPKPRKKKKKGKRRK